MTETDNPRLLEIDSRLAEVRRRLTSKPPHGEFALLVQAESALLRDREALAALVPTTEADRREWRGLHEDVSRRLVTLEAEVATLESDTRVQRTKLQTLECHADCPCQTDPALRRPVEAKPAGRPWVVVLIALSPFVLIAAACLVRALWGILR